MYPEFERWIKEKRLKGTIKGELLENLLYQSFLTGRESGICYAVARIERILTGGKTHGADKQKSGEGIR